MIGINSIGTRETSLLHTLAAVFLSAIDDEVRKAVANGRNVAVSYKGEMADGKYTAVEIKVL